MVKHFPPLKTLSFFPPHLTSGLKQGEGYFFSRWGVPNFSSPLREGGGIKKFFDRRGGGVPKILRIFSNILHTPKVDTL